MKYEKFDSASIDLAIGEIREMFKEFKEKTGIALSFKSTRYDEYDFSFSCKGEIAEKHDDIEKKNFERSCFKFGLKKDYFGKSFLHEGLTYTIIGINTRARKYPVICKKSNGVTIKTTADFVNYAMKDKKWNQYKFGCTT